MEYISKFKASLTNSNGRISKSVSPLVVNSFLLLLSIAITLTPVFGRECSKVLRICVILCWYLSIPFIEGYSKFVFLPQCVFFLGIFLYESLLRIIGFSSASIGNYFTIFCSIDILIKSLFIFQFYPKKLKTVCYRILQIIVLINILDNIYLSIKFPGIHHLVYFYPQDYLHVNYAMTEFYNSLSFFIGVVFIDLLCFKPTHLFAFIDFASIIVSFCFLVFIEPRATSILVSSALLIGLFFLKKGNIYVTIGKYLIVVVALLSYLSFVTRLIEQFVSPRLFSRIYALFTFNFSYDDSFGYRIELFTNSLKTWLSSFDSFLFGIGNHLGSEYYSLIGQHSFITDSLAKYGCIGLVMLLFLFRSLFVSFFSCQHNSSIRKCFLFLFFIFSLFSFVANSMSPEILCTSFLSIALLLGFSGKQYSVKTKEVVL